MSYLHYFCYRIRFYILINSDLDLSGSKIAVNISTKKLLLWRKKSIVKSEYPHITQDWNVWSGLKRMTGHRISGSGQKHGKDIHTITNLAVSLLELSQNLSSADFPDVNLASLAPRR